MEGPGVNDIKEVITMVEFINGLLVAYNDANVIRSKAICDLIAQSNDDKEEKNDEPEECQA